MNFVLNSDYLNYLVIIIILKLEIKEYELLKLQ